MEIYNSEILTLEYKEDGAQLIQRWRPYFEDKYGEEDVKKAGREMIPILEEFVIKSQVIYVALDYTFPPSLQKWIDDNLTTTFIKQGMEKVAIIVTREFIEQIEHLSIEQLTEEENTSQVSTRFFTYEQEQDAYKWIISEDNLDEL